MWELTAVAVVAVACVGIAAVLDGRRVGLRATSRTTRLAWRGGGVAVALVLIVAELIPLLAQLRIGASQRASRQGKTALALADARAAVRVQPWAATPHLQLALVYEQTGDLASARTEIHRALARDPEGWQLALVSARLETESGNIAAARRRYARARALNPRSPLFAPLTHLRVWGLCFAGAASSARDHCSIRPRRSDRAQVRRGKGSAFSKDHRCSIAKEA